MKSEKHYVLIDFVKNELIESKDVIYAESSIKELYKDGFELKENEKFIELSQAKKKGLL